MCMSKSLIIVHFIKFYLNIIVSASTDFFKYILLNYTTSEQGQYT